jgi:WD40 repeat protein
VSEIPSSDWTWINATADRFERTWKQEPRPRIEDFLAEVDEERRPRLLEELLRVECELRRRAGDDPVVAEYAARFPEHAALIEAVFSPGLAPSTPSEPPFNLPTIAPGTTDGQIGGNGEPAPGDRVRYFGDYEIDRELARGGMGVVFRARQISLNRTVALKMILAGQLADANDVKRFYTEAEAAAQLDHPGIVPIFEVGQHDGQHFFSMAFVEGRSLAERLADGPMPPREAAALLLDVTRAIEYAHSRGVIHRDLKPSNILIGADGNPRVTDFGLAKRVHGDSGLTGSGQIMGTPSYMPPEQAGGRRSEVGPAADVYALGATLYCMVTGRPPFQAATAMDTVLQVLSDEPVPLRRLNAAIPPDLETICLKCLEKEPGKRYAGAAALTEDLRRFLAGEPILARPVTRFERAVKWARRRPGISALLGLIALVTALGLGGVLWQWREAVFARGVAERESGRAKAQTELAERESERAKAQTELAEQRLYDVRMIFVQRNWEDYHGNLLAQGLDEQLPANQSGVDRRGFEWFHWRRKTLSGRIRLEGYPDLPFLRVQLSRDGRRIIGGGPDGAVNVWDATTGQEILRLKGHTSPITSVAYSPDGRRLASAAKDLNGPGQVKVWDAATGQEICILTADTGWVDSMAFSPDGQRLASGNSDWELNLWDGTTGQAIHTLEPAIHTLMGGRAAVFSPDGRRLAAGSILGQFKLWDAVTGREICALKGPDQVIFSMVFSPDGQRLAGGGSGAGTVTVWDAATGQEIRTLKRHSSPVSSIAFTPDGRRLASASLDSAVKLWDAATGQEIRTLKGRTSPARSLAFSPDGSRLSSAGGDGTVKVWDVVTDQETLTIRAPTRGVQRVAFDPSDNFQIACGGRDGTVTLLHAATGQEIRTLKGHTGDVRDVAFSPDGSRLASASQDQTVRLWDAATGMEKCIFRGHTKSVATVAFSPDGRRLASAGADLTVKVWDAATGQEIRTLNARTIQVTSVAFSPDGKRLAASGSGTLEVWDLATGHEALTTKVQGGLLWDVAFSPDGQHLASAGSDGTVRVWDAATGRPIRTLNGHTNGVLRVIFSPDGRRIGSAGLDGSVRIWNAATGQETLTLNEHTASVMGVVFSRDGHRLAASHVDGTIKVWDARPLDDEPTSPGPMPR